MEIDMGLLLLLLVAGAAILGAGVFTGYHARIASHMFKIRKDARFVILILGEMSALLLSAMFIGGDIPSMVLIFIMLFDPAYIAGYKLANMNSNDVVNLDVYYHKLNRNRVGPIARFYRDGEQCTMLQTLKASFRSIVGCWDTLDYDDSGVVRTRTVEAWGGKKYAKYEVIVCLGKEPVDLGVIGFVKIGSRMEVGTNGAIHREPKYLFYFPRQHHKIIPCASAEQDPRMFEIEGTLMENAVLDAQVQRQLVNRLQIQLVEAKYEGAGELVRGMIDLTLDTFGARERILYEIGILAKERKPPEQQTNNNKGGDAAGINT